MNESTLVPREEMSDLDWLARNVHNWPAGHQGWCYVISNRDGTKGVATSLIGQFDCPWVRIETQEWLTRRAELQNKPTEWPDGANWLAQDKDGEWYFYKDTADNPPQNHGEENWFSDEAGDIRCRRIGEVLGDWRDTLEKRPADMSEQAVTARLKDATDNVLAAVPELMADKYKFTPFISIEDNQEKAMKQDNGWYERGDLPPVGAVCYIRHSCWNSEKYDKVTIVAITNEYLIVKYETLEQHYMLKDISFRPIRTERDELVNVFINHYGNPKGAEGYIGIADAILAAGFSLGDK